MTNKEYMLLMHAFKIIQHNPITSQETGATITDAISWLAVASKTLKEAESKGEIHDS